WPAPGRGCGGGDPRGFGRAWGWLLGLGYFTRREVESDASALTPRPPGGLPSAPQEGRWILNPDSGRADQRLQVPPPSPHPLPSSLSKELLATWKAEQRRPHTLLTQPTASHLRIVLWPPGAILDDD